MRFGARSLARACLSTGLRHANAYNGLMVRSWSLVGCTRGPLACALRRRRSGQRSDIGLVKISSVCKNAARSGEKETRISTAGSRLRYLGRCSTTRARWPPLRPRGTCRTPTAHIATQSAKEGWSSLGEAVCRTLDPDNVSLSWTFAKRNAERTLPSMRGASSRRPVQIPDRYQRACLLGSTPSTRHFQIA